MADTNLEIPSTIRKLETQTLGGLVIVSFALGRIFVELQRPRAKLTITKPPKVWVSSFLIVDRISKLVSAIMENGKNGRTSPKMKPR